MPQKFRIRQGGTGGITQPLVEIEILSHCPTCGLHLKLNHSFEQDCFDVQLNSCCSAMYATYPKIWANQIIRDTAPTYPNGVVCNKCHGRNPYAVPNRPNGIYVCYECK